MAVLAHRDRDIEVGEHETAFTVPDCIHDVAGADIAMQDTRLVAYFVDTYKSDINQKLNIRLKETLIFDELLGH